MLRMFIPIALLAVFIGWVAYRTLIKRDLTSQLNNLYAGLAFVAVWAVIYWAML